MKLLIFWLSLILLDQNDTQVYNFRYLQKEPYKFNTY